MCFLKIDEIAVATLKRRKVIPNANVAEGKSHIEVSRIVKNKKPIAFIYLSSTQKPDLPIDFISM